MKKLISIICVLILSISLFCIPANAANYSEDGVNSIQSSLYIKYYDASIAAESGGSIIIDCTVTGTGIMDTIGVSTCNIQKYQSGSWTTVRTIYNIYEYDTITTSCTITYQGVVGSQYRAVITFYAANSSGSDSKTMTTSSVTAIS